MPYHSPSMTTLPDDLVAPPPKEEPNDLGFGAVVARESRRRFLNRDGSFNVERHGLPLLESLSLYHELLVMPWSLFVGVVGLSYLLLNTIFATIYYLMGPGALAGEAYLPRFWQCFFFSVDTLATIGYGDITPATLGANFLVTIESLVGVLGLALTAGLIFAKFSRPVADILFSRFAVIAPYREISAFMFRIANKRKSQLVELRAKVMLGRWKKGEEGQNREFFPLRLERDRVSFFPLTWTVVHPIDSESPLWGASDEELRRSEAEFLILLSGIDETVNQVVHTRSSYRIEEVRIGHRFKSIINSTRDDGKLSVNLKEMHEIEEAALPNGKA